MRCTKYRNTDYSACRRRQDVSRLLLLKIKILVVYLSKKAQTGLTLAFCPPGEQTGKNLAYQILFVINTLWKTGICKERHLKCQTHQDEIWIPFRVSRLKTKEGLVCFDVRLKENSTTGISPWPTKLEPLLCVYNLSFCVACSYFPTGGRPERDGGPAQVGPAAARLSVHSQTAGRGGFLRWEQH